MSTPSIASRSQDLIRPERVWANRLRRLLNRYHARAASRADPATAFVQQPEPRSIGRLARGRQLVAGNFLFAGHLVEAPGTSPFAIDAPDWAFLDELHGFAWLDDLAALGDADARERAQAWVHDWIARSARGRGPGWEPELTGRRLIRWINHAIFLLRGKSAEDSKAFFRSLGQQTIFLSRRWRATPSGLPRFEALAGLIYAGLSLSGLEDQTDEATAALVAACRDQIDDEGGVPTRNPEELLEVFTLLVWVAQALTEANRPVPGDLTAAMGRIAPTLRALRHGDGGLARFHGGGRGIEGRLDAALANSGIRERRNEGLYMGFARLTCGRTSVVVDAAPPPVGEASASGHASTLAFELTSGRRPLIVNCGSGETFGADWRRAGRATPSHSTLGIEGFSSSRLGQARLVRGQRREFLNETPAQVSAEIAREEMGFGLEATHDGYARGFGLTHGRRLELNFDGRGLIGEDYLVALDAPAERIFDGALDSGGLEGIAFTIRFHLHPDVDASIDLAGGAISLALRSGEIWVFRKEGPVEMRIEPSVFLEKGRLKPRSAGQVVLSGRAMTYATRVRWSLAKAQETPDGIRDLYRDDDLADPGL